MLILLLVANFVMVGTFLLRLRSLPPQVPLFYSRPPGEAQLGEWWFVFLVPLLMNVFYFMTIYIYRKFYSGNEFIRTFLHFFRIALIIVFSAIFLKIIFLIT